MNEPQVVEPSLSSYVGRIARIIDSEGFSTGHRAALRRMNPTQAPPLQFYAFALRNLPENWEWYEADWMTLVACVALISPNGHRPDRGLGKALAEAGYSEARLERLLDAEGTTRRTLLMRAARFLAAKSSAANWTDGAQLLLVRNEEQRRRLHRRVAQDFYRNINN